MEKRLELERRGRNPDQIKDLNLDNARSANIVGLNDEYVNLESLSLINVGLANLKGFPNLPKLKRLELSDNRISGGINYLKGCPNLKTLNLCGNKITDFEALEPLKDFKCLENLDLFNCDITQTDNYREKVFNLIPSLKYLDGFDCDEKEKDLSENEEEDEESSDNDSNMNEEDSELDEDEDQVVDDEELDEEDESSDSDADEEEVGLSALIGDINEESDNEENFEPETTNGDHASEESDIESDADESKDLTVEQEQRGQKRKHDPEEEVKDE